MEDIQKLKNYANELKDIPFAKSWESTFISKTHQILNTETGKTEAITINDFLFIPGIHLLKHYSSDSSFLSFRSENLYEDNWDYKLLENKTDNNNRRMAVFYVSRMLDALEISFRVDNNYGIYIEIEELAKKAREAEGELQKIYKDIYYNFSVPKSITSKVGEIESWGN